MSLFRALKLLNWWSSLLIFPIRILKLDCLFACFTSIATYYVESFRRYNIVVNGVEIKWGRKLKNEMQSSYKIIFGYLWF